MKFVPTTFALLTLVASSMPVSAADWQYRGVFEADISTSEGKILLLFRGTRDSDPRVLVSRGDKDAMVEDFDRDGYVDVGYVLEVDEVDVSDDGRMDVITAPGPGGGPRVVLAYDAGFRGGVVVASGDVNGDGNQITGAGVGGGPHVKTFAYDPGFLGGVVVATGDVTGDGVADLVVAADQGGGPHVK